MEQKRGQLTDRVQAKGTELFGRPISLRELRLIPYVSHCMQNSQKIEPIKINTEERAILQQWRDEKHIEGGASGLAMTKDFWDAMQELIWLAYCDTSD